MQKEGPVFIAFWILAGAPRTALRITVMTQRVHKYQRFTRHVQEIIAAPEENIRKVYENTLLVYVLFLIFTINLDIESRRNRDMKRRWIRGNGPDNIRQLQATRLLLPLTGSVFKGGTWAPTGFAFSSETAPNTSPSPFNYRSINIIEDIKPRMT